MNDNEGDALRSLIRANARQWLGGWAWRDKPVGELGAARTILQAAGIHFAELRSREDDPPDCEARLDGSDQVSAIEVTELIDQETLDRAMKAIRERDAGLKPEQPEAYFAWDRASLLGHDPRRTDHALSQALRRVAGILMAASEAP